MYLRFCRIFSSNFSDYVLQSELFIKSRENTGGRNKNALTKRIETHRAFLVCLYVFNIDPGTTECPETLGYNSI